MKALIIIAQGSEEIETVTITNLLVRAGIKVTLASVDRLQVTAARGLQLTADALIDDIPSTDEFDVVVLPGGVKGANNIAQNDTARKLLVMRHERRQLIAAICASPALVLQKWQLLNGYHATCYPEFMTELPHYLADKVVQDRHILTSQGPATAAELSFAIIKLIAGELCAEQVAQSTLFIKPDLN